MMARFPILQGVRDSLPVGIGYFPVAFSFGVSCVQAGFTPAFATSVSAFIFAGASQFALLSMLTVGSSGLGVISVVFLMNLRHVFYGPSLLTKIEDKQPHFAFLDIAFGLTDEVFATAFTRMEKIPPRARHRWCLGLEVGAYTVWVGATFAGAILGKDLISQSKWLGDVLGFVLPALLCALVIELAFHCQMRVLFVSILGTGLALALFSNPGLALIAGMLSGAIVSGKK